MREAIGNLWEFPTDLRAITTNGDVNRRGEAVMGRGVALQAKKRFPDCARDLGALISRKGNHVHLLGQYKQLSPAATMLVPELASFPVKEHWYDRANLDLIERSARELIDAVDKLGYGRITLPRPGCGNGGRAWDEVHPILADLFDDRFIIVDFASAGGDA